MEGTTALRVGGVGLGRYGGMEAGYRRTMKYRVQDERWARAESGKGC